MDRDTALAKIKKCLALSKSANANEAATAMRQAQKLMAEHSISDGELQLGDVAEAETAASGVVITTWDATLTRLVADTFGCEVISVMRRQLGRSGVLQRKRTMAFVGVGAAGEVASYCYAVLLRQVLRDRRAHMAKQPGNCKAATRTARGDAFALAWVAGVSDLVERFAGTETNRALLETYMRTRYPDSVTSEAKNRAVGRNVKDDSYRAGLAAGKKAQLDRGVGGPMGQERLA